MFGFGKLKAELKYAEWKRESDRIRIGSLEKHVTELTNALGWHVGTSVEIILAERKLVKLKVAEQKKLVEETGSADLVQQPGGDLAHEGPKGV